MPEGPEVWILSKAINLYYSNENTTSYGKHLFILNEKENWSFALTGKVGLDKNNNLFKLEMGWLYGDKLKYENINDETNKLGIDFMTTDDNLIKDEIEKWHKSKKKLAGLILDQTKISGIGVAWGSEILFKAELRPDMRACDQDLSKLLPAIFYIKNKIIHLRMYFR